MILLKKFLPLMLLLTAIVFTTQANATAPVARQAKVTRAVDGDTVMVSISKKTETVRLIGVNTPETKHPTKGVEPYGKEASAYTTKQLTGKIVWLQTDVGQRDNYGRLLAYVWLKKPTSGNQTEAIKSMYNAQLMINGYAQVMTIPPNVAYADLFVKLQQQARKQNRGLWGIDPIKAGVKAQQITKPATKPTSVKGGGPKGETIKGNINSKGEKIYHVPGGQFYKVTDPEAWFFTEAAAVKAGYRKSKR